MYQYNLYYVIICHKLLHALNFRYLILYHKSYLIFHDFFSELLIFQKNNVKNQIDLVAKYNMSLKDELIFII